MLMEEPDIDVDKLAEAVATAQAHAAAVAAWSKDFKIHVITDTMGPIAGKIQFDKTKKQAFLGLGEGISIEGINWSEVYNGWLERETSPLVDASEMIEPALDPMLQRTCAFYSPAKDYVDNFGAEMHPDYEYDRPHNQPVCHNPAVATLQEVANPECMHMWHQSGCEFFSLGEQTLIASYDVDGLYKIDVFKDRNGHGIPVFTAYKVYPTHRAMAWKLSYVQFDGDKTSVKSKTEWLFSHLRQFISDFAKAEKHQPKVTYKMEDPFSHGTAVEITHRKLLENVCKR